MPLPLTAIGYLEANVERPSAYGQAGEEAKHLAMALTHAAVTGCSGEDTEK